jgi:hypothetical protein
MSVPLRLSRHRPAAAPDANDASRGGAAGPGTSVNVWLRRQSGRGLQDYAPVSFCGQYATFPV